MTRSTLMLLAFLLPLADSYVLSYHTGPHARQSVQPRAAVNAALGDDIRTVGTVALASLVLITSPMAAYAKGGGHGGGGHSGGGHSSSHSSYHSSPRTLHQYNSGSVSRSSRSSSRSSRQRYGTRSSSSRRYSSSTSASPPPPIRLYPDKDTARRENGYFCPANLPKPGERVEVLGESNGKGQTLSVPRRMATVVSSRPASQASLYGDSGKVLQPVPGFESDCSVNLVYDDGTMGTVSAAEEPTPWTTDLAPWLVYGAITAASRAMDGDDAWERAEERHEEILDELRLASTGLRAPCSGEYWGCSEESDEGDQAVRCTISFDADGSITGRGIDGVDGTYRIVRGQWGALDGDSELTTVAWIEKYDEGFEVAVEGRYDARDGKIEAHFSSSRGVRGNFELVQKPSIF